jgi:CRP/FNR family transcriptional regulator, dissimilatory nitrate respiration regulator
LVTRTLAADILGKLPLFRHTSPARLAEVARHARTEHVLRGTVIARRGDRPRGLTAVAYGLVKLSLRGDTEKVLRLVGPGETFSEAVLFLDKPIPVDAVALADTLLVVVKATPLLALIDTDRGFARELLASMSQRIHELVMDFEATTQHGARERLAAYLDSLAPPGVAEAAIQLPASKTVVAARLGVTKETLSRLLRQMGDEGLIAMSKRDITLRDRSRLTAAARGDPPA